MGYNPIIGRFVQRDPIGYDDGMNSYAFVGANPINWLDPLGLDRTQNPGVAGEPDSQAQRERINKWADEQTKKLTDALKALCPTKKVNQNNACACSPEGCAQQAEELGKAIVEALRSERMKYGDQNGGDWGNRLNYVALPGNLLGAGWNWATGTPQPPDPTRINNECGDWQNIVMGAINSVMKGREGRDSSRDACFLGRAMSGSQPRDHQWVEIQTVLGSVTIDPWPTGSKGDIIDSSVSTTIRTRRHQPIL